MLTQKNNTTNSSFCIEPQTFNTIEEFFYCLSFFMNQNLIFSIFGLALLVLIQIANITLILILLKHKLSIFEQITFGLCLMDTITGLIDYPFFIIRNIFGYFPFNKVIAHLWCTYDNNVNTTTALHMLYMSFVLLRSIESPYNFKTELLIKRPRLAILLIWLTGLGIWSPIANLYGIIPYTLDINFRYSYEKFIFSFIFWFMLLILLLIIGIILIYDINLFKNKRINVLIGSKQETNVDKLNAIKKIQSTNLRSQLKIVILVFTFWLQWIIPCSFYILNTIFNFIPDQVMNKIYWLTYTVCFTDPIVVYFLNPHIGLSKSKNSNSNKYENKTLTISKKT